MCKGTIIIIDVTVLVMRAALGTLNDTGGLSDPRAIRNDKLSRTRGVRQTQFPLI